VLVGIELSERPFVTPGSSPFRAKGTTYIGHLQWVAEKYPGGLDAYFDALGFDHGVQAFHKQKFMAPGWYDFVPLACAGYTCARAMKMSFEEFIHYRARYQAELDMRGVYKLLLTVTPNSFTARKLTSIMAQYFDFTTTTVREEQKGHVVAEVSGVPAMFVPWMRACFSGFIEVVLKTGGAKGVRVGTRDRLEGEAHGYPAAVVAIEISWT
jgi:hypothetical protein